MEIGFVSFNQEALGRAGKVLKMLQGQGAIDELGLGRIRDAFSNSMFPGLSVLQTRAKYFVMLPALYAHLERKRIANAREARSLVREYEIKLTDRLLRSSGLEAGGIIGAESLRKREQYVKYDPTYVYISGMETYGLVKTSGNIYAMLAERSAARQGLPEHVRGPEAEDSDDLDGMSQIFLTPAVDYTFESSGELFITLSPAEARFLKERIVRAVPDSLLAELLDSGVFRSLTDDEFEAIGPTIQPVVSAQNYRIYTLALRYSRFANLLRLFYAMLYNRGVGAADEALEMGRRFTESLTAPHAEFAPGQIEEILDFAKPRISEDKSIGFCLKAARLISEGDYAALEREIVNREQDIKGPRRSKLLNPQDYEPGHPFDVPALMTYRWSTIVKTVFRDIAQGLDNG